METYLDDAETAAVVSFCKDTVMFDAVKKVVLHTVYSQGVIVPGKKPDETNFIFGLFQGGAQGIPSNEQLGEELRAAMKGLGFLQSGFEKLKTFRVQLPKKPKTNNPAL